MLDALSTKTGLAKQRKPDLSLYVESGEGEAFIIPM